MCLPLVQGKESGHLNNISYKESRLRLYVIGQIRTQFLLKYFAIIMSNAVLKYIKYKCFKEDKK